MFKRMERRGAGRTVCAGASVVLFTVLAGAAWAQEGGGPPAITGTDQSEYCVTGDVITLNGANFGAQGSRGYVVMGAPVRDGSGGHTFQDFPLSIQEWSNTRIRARLFLPGGADFGTWVVTVHRDDGQAASQTFIADVCAPRAEADVDPAGHHPLPRIDNLQMTRFRPGDRLIFMGQDFGNDRGSVTLVGLFGDANGVLYYREFPASMELWTNFRIMVPVSVPAGAVPGTWVATIHRTDGETASTAFTLVPAPPPPPTPTPALAAVPDCRAAGDPVIEDVQRTQYCITGDFLVIHGEHFCNDPDGGWVTITSPYRDAQGNVQYQESRAAVVGWLSTQIHVQFIAPPASIPGAYTATVHVHRFDSAGRDVVRTASVSFNVVACGSGGG